MPNAPRVKMFAKLRGPQVQQKAGPANSVSRCEAKPPGSDSTAQYRGRPRTPARRTRGDLLQGSLRGVGFAWSPNAVLAN